MSMETFQNVDEWLVSEDVSNMLTCWKEEEPGFVPGLDDDDAGADYLTSTCTSDGLGCYDVTDFLNSSMQMSESWLDLNEVLSCDNKALDQSSSGQMSDGQANELGIQSSTNFQTTREQLPEVNISELESLLLMDSEGMSAGGSGLLAGCVTFEPSALESLNNNADTCLEFVPNIMEDEPVTTYCEVEEDSSCSSSSEEEDTRDTTWSYRNHTTRPQRRCRRRRSKPTRRLSAARNNMADERKKQQNKSAATRYREKKRTEELENELLCAALEKRNRELRTRVQDLTQEVAVLRKLVIDIFKNSSVCTA